MKEEVYLELWVRPETHDKPWHATLETEEHEKLEFDSPLELARHLASLGKHMACFKGIR